MYNNSITTLKKLKRNLHIFGSRWANTTFKWTEMELSEVLNASAGHTRSTGCFVGSILPDLSVLESRYMSKLAGPSEVPFFNKYNKNMLT